MAGNSEDRDKLLIIITLHNVSWFHYQVKYSAASLLHVLDIVLNTSCFSGCLTYSEYILLQRSWLTIRVLNTSCFSTACYQRAEYTTACFAM